MSEILIEHHAHSMSVRSEGGVTHVDLPKCRAVLHAVTVGRRARIDEPLVCSMLAVIQAAEAQMESAAVRLQKAHARSGPTDPTQMAAARYSLLEAQAARDLAAQTIHTWHRIEKRIAAESKET